MLRAKQLTHFYSAQANIIRNTQKLRLYVFNTKRQIEKCAKNYS